MGDKLKNAGKSALKSLLVTIPATVVAQKLGVTADPLKSGAVIVGTGASAAALSSLGKDVYDETSNYLDERERFRRMQNYVLSSNGALEFTNPNTGVTKVLPAGVGGSFSQVDAARDALNRKPTTWENMKSAVGKGARTTADYLEGKTHLPTVKGDGVAVDAANGAIQAVDLTLRNSTIGAGIRAADNLVSKNDTLNYLLKSHGSGNMSEVTSATSEVDNCDECRKLIESLPEEYQEVVDESFWCVHDGDIDLRLERTRDMLPDDCIETFDKIVELKRKVYNFSEYPALNSLVQGGDFAVGAVAGAVAKKVKGAVVKGVKWVADKFSKGKGKVVAEAGKNLAEKGVTEAVTKAAENTAEVAADTGAKAAEATSDAIKNMTSAGEGLGGKVAKEVTKGPYHEEFQKSMETSGLNNKIETPEIKPTEPPKVEPKPETTTTKPTENKVSKPEPNKTGTESPKPASVKPERKNYGRGRKGKEAYNEALTNYNKNEYVKKNTNNKLNTWFGDKLGGKGNTMTSEEKNELGSEAIFTVGDTVMKGAKAVMEESQKRFLINTLTGNNKKQQNQQAS